MYNEFGIFEQNINEKINENITVNFFKKLCNRTFNQHYTSRNERKAIHNLHRLKLENIKY